MDYFLTLWNNNEGVDTETSIEQVDRSFSSIIFRCHLCFHLQRNCEETCAIYLLPVSCSTKGVVRELRETGFINDSDELCLLRKK
jgi:hypothetical protein